jgi:predicted nucleic acid-binding protein
MTFADVPGGTSVFVDANTFVYACGPDPQFGPPSLQLLERIERKDLQGFTSTHVLSDVAHRLMSLEACAVLGWPYAGIAQRLKRHHTQPMKLYHGTSTTYLKSILKHGLRPRAKAVSLPPPQRAAS